MQRRHKNKRKEVKGKQCDILMVTTKHEEEKKKESS